MLVWRYFLNFLNIEDDIVTAVLTAQQPVEHLKKTSLDIRLTQTDLV